jgi:acyl dehydratase
MAPGTFSFAIRRPDLARYAAASGDLNPIHLSSAAAAAAGLPDVIAHGMLIMGVAMRVVTQWAGDPGSVRDCRARFLQPVAVPVDVEIPIEVEAQAVEVPGAAEATVTLLVRTDGRLVARVTARIALDQRREPLQANRAHWPLSET